MGISRRDRGEGFGEERLALYEGFILVLAARETPLSSINLHVFACRRLGSHLPLVPAGFPLVPWFCDN